MPVVTLDGRVDHSAQSPHRDPGDQNMEEIRVFTEEHVGDAATLYLKAARGESGPAPRSLQDQMKETFLGNPWVSPEIPSLVYLDQGKLVGFLGVIPRPMRFRGRPIQV